LRLINRAAVLVGNSSVGVREAGYLGVPVVNVGSRQTGRERGRNVIDCDYRMDSIRHSIEQQLRHGRHQVDHLYGDGTAGRRIAEILATSELSSNKRFFDNQRS
jgi:UDP-N-acetylglucosamine 2-epimerase